MTKESSVKPGDHRILTINGGSSSIKFALCEAGDSLRQILEGGIGRIKLPEATLQMKGLDPANYVLRLVAEADHTAGACRAQRTVLERKLPPKAALAIEGATA